MNIPTHLAVGTLASIISITWKPRQSSQTCLERWPFATSLVCVGYSVASHLLLDAIPHYDVLYKILAFPTLPVIPQLAMVGLKVLLCSLPVLVLIWPFLKSHPGLMAATLFAAVYPDLEKGLYLNLPFPRWLVLFWQHSGAYSNDGGDQHKVAVLLFEGALLLMSLAAIWGLTVHSRRTSSEKSGHVNFNVPDVLPENNRL